MIPLGIGGLLHDPSAALMIDGRLIAAVESEKVTRHHREVSVAPVEAANAVLAQARIKFEDVDWIATN
jgi:carbamoyltransferase